MRIYSVEIKFEKEKHCLKCPLRDYVTDMCNLQKDEDNCYIEFKDWEDQLKNCLLIEI